MKRFISRAIILALPAMFSWACADADAGPSGTFDNHVTSQDPLATEVVALSFMTNDTTTACGPATGMRVVIAAQGETLTCVAPWAPAMVSDPVTGSGDEGRHFVADCFFVVAPGTWNVLAVEPIGPTGEPLACCTSEYPASVVVVTGQTTEFGVEMQCALTGPGALDIYGWLERPPIIKVLDIYPSKFGSPCVPRFFYAEAVDVDGDAIDYDWEVVTAPLANGYKLWEHGPVAIFVAFPIGDYVLRLTVTDIPHGMSTSLDFPIHVTEPAFVVKNHGDEPSCTNMSEPAIPAEFGHAL